MEVLSLPLGVLLPRNILIPLLSLTMDRLSPDQAQALFAAGGFFLLTSLPAGSEFGIDGTYVPLPFLPSLPSPVPTSLNQLSR